MNITLIIIVLLIVFVFSLVLLNFKKIKAFFAKFKKSKKKKSSKTKGKKDANNKSAKLQKSTTQTRPILRPPESKKPEEKKEESTNSEVKKEEYQDSVKPISAPMSAPTINQISATGPSNAFSGSKFNMAPRASKEDLDKEFDEIRKFINSSPSGNLQRPAARPNFFGPPAPGSQANFQQGQMIQQNGQNYFRPANQSVYPQGVSGSNPFMSNPFAPNQMAKTPSYNAKSMQGFNGMPNNFGVNFPQNLSTNATSNSALNASKTNPFAQNANVANNYKNFINTNSKPLTPSSSSSVYNSFNLDNMGEGSSAKIKIDDDEIDLNKLSPNVKKLIISNILARKNFDD